MKKQREKIYNFFISNFFGRYVSLLLATIAIVTLFGTIDINDFPSARFFVSVGMIIMVPFLINVFFEILSDSVKNAQGDVEDLKNILDHRIGSQKSMNTENDFEIDRNHRYNLILRQDLINYDNPNYYSFRQLRGINVGKGITNYVIHTESYDLPIAFNEISIKARNNINQKDLVVECIHSCTDKRLQHTFKIYFDKPVHPNGFFDISYSIIIPNELTVYSKEKEIQSIALVRIKQPITELDFSVCLNYDPRAVRVYSRKITGEITEINTATVQKYVPSTELERLYSIDWNHTEPYIIRAKVDNPNSDQYIIMFVK